MMLLGLDELGQYSAGRVKVEPSTVPLTLVLERVSASIPPPVPSAVVLAPDKSQVLPLSAARPLGSLKKVPEIEPWTVKVEKELKEPVSVPHVVLIGWTRKV